MKKLTSKQLNDLNKKKPVERLLEIIAILRNPDSGCPWDIKQDYLSLSQYPIEESYELQNAIQNNDIENIKEELGDLLLQIVLFSQIDQIIQGCGRRLSSGFTLGRLGWRGLRNCSCFCRRGHSFTSLLFNLFFLVIN